MVYKKSTGLNDTTVVRSNILRNTDNRMYVSTAAGIRAINTDGSYSTLANTCGVNPMFLTIPIIVISYQREQVQSSFAQHSGQKVYELKDHLGNVRAVVTDRKFLTLTGTTPIYKAELASVTDYYAYGSPLYGRTYTSAAGSYRFGFNTQEKVDEISGEGNHNTALFWEYDTRLGRRWNLDPKPQINISDYAVMGCNPVLMIDWLGDKVINGWKKDIDYWQGRVDKWKSKSESQKSKISKWWYEQRMNKAQKQLDKANSFFKITEEAIKDYASMNKEDFDIINKLPDISVKVDEGYKIYDFVNNVKVPLRGAFIYYFEGAKCYYEVKISNNLLEVGNLALRKRFGHEFGHFWFLIIHNWEYQTYYETHIVTKGGHGDNRRIESLQTDPNPTGLAADEWELRTK